MENRKGRDIGYALAASSREGANSVDACTVTALDVTTAFAVPNPNYTLRRSRIFQVGKLIESPLRADHPAYFGLAKYYFRQPFQPSTRVKVNSWAREVNAIFRCKCLKFQDAREETQSIAMVHAAGSGG
jgi:hypothetical protein